jgi:hypothetical protein
MADIPTFGLEDVVVTAERIPLPPPPIERRPQAQVLIRRGVAAESQLPDWWCDVSGHVLRVHTTKTLSRPDGTFEVTCTMAPLGDAPMAAAYLPELAAMPLSAVLCPNDLVWIALDPGLPPPWGKGFETIMIGWITMLDVAMSIDHRGHPMRTVTIAGSDLGKFYLGHELPGYMLSVYIQGDQEAARRTVEGLSFMGTVSHVLGNLYRGVFYTLQPAPYAVVEEGQLLIDPALDGVGADAFQSYLGMQSVWTAHGKFWNLFTTYADLQWNEVYGDYVVDPANSAYSDFTCVRPSAAPQPLAAAGGGPGYYLIARRKPFPWGAAGSPERTASESRWDALPMTQLLDVEILQEQVRLSDEERVNVVLINPQGGGVTNDTFQEALRNQTALFDKDSMARHGTHILSSATPYADFYGTTIQNPEAQRELAQKQGAAWVPLARRVRALFDWYWPNHLFYCGSWVVAGNPSIRIGTRVRNRTDVASVILPSEAPPRQFYVEGVVQDYVDGSHYFTHLALTRGQSLVPADMAKLIPAASLPETIPAGDAAPSQWMQPSPPTVPGVPPPKGTG